MSSSRRAGDATEIRIGINTGEVVAGDSSSGHGFVTGDAINVAKRIEQAAQPGEILLGEATSTIVHHAVTTAAVPPLQAKGKPDTLTTHRLVDVDLTSDALPRRPDAPLVGRAAELRSCAPRTRVPSRPARPSS